MNPKASVFVVVLVILGIAVLRTKGQRSIMRPSAAPRPVATPRNGFRSQFANPRATILTLRQQGRRHNRSNARQRTTTTTPCATDSSHMTKLASKMTAVSAFFCVEFLADAEVFFKDAAWRVGMTRRGADAAWSILVKYSTVGEIDPTQKTTPEEEKRWLKKWKEDTEWERPRETDRTRTGIKGGNQQKDQKRG